MATSDMKPIRVHILGREYALRVRKGEESTTRQLAAQLNARMEAFRDEHPEQAELTASVITALAMAEEINDLRSELESAREEAEAARKHEHAMQQLIAHMSEQLADVLPSGALPVDPESAPALPTNDGAHSDAPDLSPTSDGHASPDVPPPSPALVTDSNRSDRHPSSESDASGESSPSAADRSESDTDEA